MSLSTNSNNFLGPIVTRDLHQDVAALADKRAHEATVNENVLRNDSIWKLKQSFQLSSIRFTAMKDSQTRDYTLDQKTFVLFIQSPQQFYFAKLTASNPS
ncbi:hypothetical protein BPOR_0177g00100 [Botrytis porri]|uniref:Uncharacterized protein n=1 Tax=Botrytis porri TaxID=87229 RepID=A0A4Z1KUL4_9HELO|nr:hypothetical protein BPOR_0177g00100 [Botrytis porri]